ncbi:MAG: YCF48-related protein [Ignavibacteria bacterium]
MKTFCLSHKDFISIKILYAVAILFFFGCEGEDSKNESGENVSFAKEEVSVRFGGDIIAKDGDSQQYIEELVEMDGRKLFAGNNEETVEIAASGIREVDLIGKAAYSNSGWFWLNPQPQGNSLNSIKFVNSQTGFAVGNFGTIMRTNNAGESWNVFNTNFNNDLHSIAFTNDNTIYVCGTEGIILKTTNSGISWNRILSSTSDTLFFVFFSDVNTGYICGDEGRILKTSDAGESWINQQSGVTNTLRGIYFLDNEKGFVCGKGIVLKTTNGGNNWTINSNSFNSNAITFVNELTGFVVGASDSREIRKTTNGGNSWLLTFLPDFSKALTSIQFINPTTGFASGKSSAFFKTTNTGLNWSRNYTITGEFNNLQSVYFSDSSMGYLAGTYGTIFKSTDTGNNWTQKAPYGVLGTFGQISFPSQHTGYITGNSGSTIFKTTNEGLSWQNLFTPFSRILNQYFVNDFVGFAIAWPKLYKTSNGGSSWNEINVPNDTVNVGAQFINENTGFIVTVPYQSTQQYFKTTNSGNSWIPHIFSPGYIGKIYFPNSNTGYLASLTITDTSNVLYKSTDLGETWNFVGNIKTESGNVLINTMTFVNENLIFVFSPNSSGNFTLYKSTNGGNNWMQSGDFNERKIVRFANQNTGYLIGSWLFSNYVWKTTDQGENWDSIKMGEVNIYDISFINDNTGYMTGDGGLIKKTTTGGVIAVESASTFVPDKLTLEQNYPNPFNPVTNLEFGISDFGFVTLKIYDILGKEIETLINENLSAGTYTVKWNAANYTSGIYFYELRTNGFSETRKMVFLK